MIKYKPKKEAISDLSGSWKLMRCGQFRQSKKFIWMK